jgi:hypothetical protein
MGKCVFCAEATGGCMLTVMRIVPGVWGLRFCIEPEAVKAAEREGNDGNIS